MDKAARRIGRFEGAEKNESFAAQWSCGLIAAGSEINSALETADSGDLRTLACSKMGAAVNGSHDC